MSPVLRGQALRYLVAGGANTALSLAIYWTLQPRIGAVPAYMVAFCTTVLTGYAIHSRWVFREPWHWRGLLRFPVVQLVNLAVGSTIVALMVHGLGVPAWIAPLVAIAVTVPLGFLLVRAAVSRRREGALPVRTGGGRYTPPR